MGLLIDRRYYPVLGSKGAELLFEWARMRKLSTGQVGAKAGTTDSTIRRLLLGGRPGLALAVRIEDLTRGWVQVRSWLDPPIYMGERPKVVNDPTRG